MKGDLHCHTRLSDGSQGIEDVIAYAKRTNLDFISLTDHDTLASFSRAKILGERYGIQIVPGVEMSAYDFERNKQVHILCYLPIKPDRLEGMCLRICENRKKAANEMAKQVMRIFPITPECITKYSASSKSVYKQHIMHALMDAGFTTRIYGNLYNQLFDPVEGSCFVGCECPDVFEVVDLIHSSGGIAVFAHPGVYDSYDLLEEMCENKLIDGIEVWHSKNKPGEDGMLLEIANKYGLLTTGGSDFHGMYASRPSPVGRCFTPQESIDAMFALHNKIKIK
ncbi:MAG: putative metal-dependent phosphoesterase family [Oscillospiraceae bacterium]|jgi:predicted metal-dependent phosphoesterase TrpH|nr:putative metal-dependent phosphoesterase family [Oscillospiraceae bacterium]